ncbi:hypothetical protein C8D77_13313 [Mesorhizobium loti]|uniref:Uncharacterized protein n=1 Tax=Rhizobium loti TaxID=381 RepID=A0A8E3B1U9_RHILI|nr:hypothetical protein C8D77_13313 [Mesorhizobium loti]
MDSMVSENSEDENLRPEVIEAVHSRGYVLLPARASDAMLDIIAAYCFQVPNGKWDVARQDASDAYAALIAAGSLQSK